MKRTPNIRFKGFDGDWEHVTIGETLVERIEQKPKSAEYPLMAFIANVGIAEKGEKYDRSALINDAENKLYKRTELGDFIYSSNNLQSGSIGLNTFGNASISPVYSIFKSTDRVLPLFIGNRLVKSDIIKEMIKWRQGVVYGQWKIHESDFLKIALLIPTIKEQKRIANLLNQIDTLISQRTKEVEKMRNIKRALLEKMFPQNGESVPQIRFKEFTEDWEEKKFDELYYRATVKNDLSFGKDKIISVANMYFNPNIVVSSDDYLRTYNIMKLGDIAYEGNKSANFAYGRFVENSIGDGIVSHVFEVLRPRGKYDLLYWKYAINNESVMRKILLKCTKKATMMCNVVISEFLQMSVLVPSIEEQRRIGTYLQKYDNMISARDRQITLLKNLKLALLEQMFVNN